MDIDLASILSEGSRKAYHPRDDSLDEYEDFSYNTTYIQFQQAYDAWLSLEEWLLSESLFFL